MNDLGGEEQPLGDPRTGFSSVQWETDNITFYSQHIQISSLKASNSPLLPSFLYLTVDTTGTSPPTVSVAHQFFFP